MEDCFKIVQSCLKRFSLPRSVSLVFGLKASIVKCHWDVLIGLKHRPNVVIYLLCHIIICLHARWSWILGSVDTIVVHRLASNSLHQGHRAVKTLRWAVVRFDCRLRAMYFSFIVLAALSPMTRDRANLSICLSWLRSRPQDTQAGSYTDSPAQHIVFYELSLRRPIGQVIWSISFFDIWLEEGIFECNGSLGICP